jgi:AcrR family transcriptional regulator
VSGQAAARPSEEERAQAMRERLQHARACIGRATPEEREAKRQRLIETAALLHRVHGYGGFTVEQLAREAGMSVGAVYLYVDSLGAIYGELPRADLAALGDARLAADVVTRLKAYPAGRLGRGRRGGWLVTADAVERAERELADHRAAMAARASVRQSAIAPLPADFRRPPVVVVPVARSRRPSANAQRMHCPKGHPYDEANTLRRRGERECRICRRARYRAWYEDKGRVWHRAWRAQKKEAA